jgi:Ca2+-binding RTX toxin-like protein
MPVRRSLAVVLAVVGLITLAHAQPMRAGTIWEWPSAVSPCGTTLQACIDGHASGDGIAIAESGPINEPIKIQNKSFSLSVEPGYTPVFESLLVENTISTPIHVSISGMVFVNQVVVEAYAGPGSVYSFDHIQAVSSGADPGFYAVIDASSTVNLTSSTFTEQGFYQGIDITGPGTAAIVTANLVGNYVSGAGTTMSLGGIEVDATDANNLYANLYNNAVWNTGQGFTTGYGIHIGARDDTGAAATLVGNTVARVTGDGIQLDDGQVAPNKFSLDLYNNIVTNTTLSAINATSQDPTTFALASGSNDFYLNHEANHTLGKSLGSNLAVQPKYTSLATGNLSLSSVSPVIDKGITCPPGGTADPDAAGNHRLAGKSVDIGAYERGAVAPTGEVVLGTSAPELLIGTAGDDILCGYGGNDTLTGGGGNDYLDGGTGADKLYASIGKSRLYGDGGKDLLCAKNGVAGDYLNGGPGTDSYRADSGDTKVSVEVLGNCN